MLNYVEISVELCFIRAHVIYSLSCKEILPNLPNI